jgi:hypothetical protein
MNISSWLLRAFSALIVGGVAVFVAAFFHNLDTIYSFGTLSRSIIRSFSEVLPTIPIWFLVPPVFFVGEFLCAIGEKLVQHAVKVNRDKKVDNKSISPEDDFEKTIKNSNIWYKDFGDFILNKDGNKKHSDDAFNLSEMHFAFGYFWGGIGALFSTATLAICAIFPYKDIFCATEGFWCLLLIVVVIVIAAFHLRHRRLFKKDCSFAIQLICKIITFVILFMAGGIILGCYIFGGDFQVIRLYCTTCIMFLFLSTFSFFKAIDYRKFANLIIYLNSVNDKIKSLRVIEDV